MGATCGLFKEILPLLQRRRIADNTPQSQGATRYDGDRPATKAGYFGVLPRELIHQIVTSLPPSSAASFALASHTLLRILGSQHLTCIGPVSLMPGARFLVTMEDRIIFLEGLVRDLPAGSSFYCHHCHKIHLLPLKKRRVVCMETKCIQELWTSKSERIFNMVDKSLCQWGQSSYNEDPDSDATTGIVYHHQFVFEHVQMAMQLHQRGLPHLLKGYLSHLSVTKPRVIEMSLSGGYKGFHFFEPRIVENQMIVRAQSWIVMPYNDRFVHKQFQLPKPLYDTTACAHHNLRGWEENPLTSLLRSGLADVRHQTSSPCVACVGNIRCPRCPTEVQVDIKTIYVDKPKTRRIIMLVVTRWQLIGGGTSPYEEPWAHRLSQRCSPWHWLEGDPLTNVKHNFESQLGTKFDSILDVREAWRLVRRTA